MSNFLIIKNANARVYNLKIPINSDSGWTALYLASGVNNMTNTWNNSQERLALIKTIVVEYKRIDKFSMNNCSDDYEPWSNGYYEDRPSDPDYEIYLENVRIIKSITTGKGGPEIDNLLVKFPVFKQMKFDVYKNPLFPALDPKIKLLEDVDEDSLKLILEIGEEENI